MPGSPEARVLAALSAVGLRFERVVFTRNRRVMVSVGERGRSLRLDECFREASSATLGSLGRLFAARTSRARSAARMEIGTFLAAAHRAHPPRRAARRRHRLLPSDAPHLARLREEFERVNAEHFGGRLPEVPIRLSGRMTRRNGHFSADPLEIAISRTLCEAAVDGEAERTLRHEMIHLWQHVAGAKPGHGPEFRRWARRLGIHPRASRTVCWLHG